MAAVARGDDQAFAVLYRRYLPVVLRWCLRETGNREAAADISAEVVAASLTASPRFWPERGGLAGWLLGIARTKLRESRRQGRVEDSARRRLGLQPVAITDADLERVDEPERVSLDPEVLARVAALPQEHRAALLSRIVGERSYAEIAGELRCSEVLKRDHEDLAAVATVSRAARRADRGGRGPKTPQ